MGGRKEGNNFSYHNHLSVGGVPKHKFQPGKLAVWRVWNVRDDESRCKRWEVVKGANKLRRVRRDVKVILCMVFLS